MNAERNEVMWCTVCGARFTQDEIKGWGCPKCHAQGVPCACDQDTTVEINWHELRILIIWAEQWARVNKDQTMTTVVAAIARRLQNQHSDWMQLTLTGEIATLAADLAKTGMKVGPIETNIPKPDLVPVNGPGAVGHVR